jgi:methyl-accepting chemotaxis protein
MQLAHFSIQQKFLLLLIPTIFYLLLLTLMVVTQQYLLNQTQQQIEGFILISLIFLSLTILITLFIISVASTIQRSFVPLLTHGKALAQGDTNTEIKSQGTDETQQLLQLYAKIQTQLRDKQHLIDYYQRMLDELKRLFAALAAGNLDENVTTEYTGDLAQLKIDINEALKQLRTAITDIKIATDATAKGILDKRVELTGKQGFLKDLAININQNLDTNQLLLEDIMAIFQALAEGNLNCTMQRNYAGTLVQLKTDVNTSIARLNKIFLEIKEVLLAAIEGRFNNRMTLDNKTGFFKELAEHLNATLNVNQNIAEEVMRVFAAVSAGDLSQSMQCEYNGNLATLKKNVNNSVAQLNTTMEEIRVVIDASAQGVLDQRIEVGSKQGFFKDLSNKLNASLEINQTMIEEVMQVFAAVSVGDLTQSMKGNYAGALAQLKEDVNISVKKLNEVMSEIREAVTVAGQGIFDNRISIEAKQGFFRELSENLNHNLDINQKMVEELMRVFAAIAVGDLTKTMQDNYQGRLGELKQDVNNSIARLNTLFEELMHVFSAMSRGDLSQLMQGSYEGRLAELKRDINNSITKLNNVMAEVGQTSEQVNTAAGEILQGNISLSQRTEQQAAALEETSSSMQQMTDTVQQNADNAEQANQLSFSAREHAEEGGKVVNRAIMAMDEINKSSKKVSDIISVIDEIAFQTNLLALNAAVEAARAGEQGRGFAVVATEVRNLAQRSAAAAKEIKSLIQDSVTKVNEGSTLVDQSGKTLEEIVTSVKRVSDIVAEIAAASREQSAGILQVNKAVTQMDEMTQQNAALVEELSSNSDSMRKQITSLNDLLRFFTFNVQQQEFVKKNVATSITKHRDKPTKPAKSTNKTTSQQRESLAERIRKSQEDSQSWENF